MKKVVLGLSGGVDSMVSALLLKREGYEVIACSFKLYNNDSSLKKAEDLAKRLEIEFRVVDLSQTFEADIIDPFVNDYINGQTPNPCVWCNNEIKAHALYQEMKRIGADYFATGHYIQIKPHNNQLFIHKGKDPNKDQSYFLWNVKADYLKHWLTPLGTYKKSEVKQIAVDHKMGFLAHGKESMSVCFLSNESYQSFIQNYPSKSSNIDKGEIVSKSGEQLGEHDGLAFYTIGQKKGLGLVDKKLMVVKMDAEHNRIHVGEKEDLYQSSLFARDFYFIDERDMLDPELKVIVRGIGHNPEGFCKIKALSNTKLQIELESPAWALAEGQPMAFYIGERLVGGGYYTK